MNGEKIIWRDDGNILWFAHSDPTKKALIDW